MQIYEVRREYGQKGREAALEAYKIVLKEHPESGEELARTAADFAHSEALSMLFEAGVSPATSDDYRFTLLHYLARQDESKYTIKPAGAVRAAADLLLDNKVSVLQKDENEKMTCYHYAARNGMAELVEALATRGVKLNMTDKEGNTGIHIACDYVRFAIKNIETSKNNLERTKKNYEETVIRFKGQGRTDEQIAQYMANNANTPEKAQQEYDAAVAAVEGYFRTVKAFAEGGVDKDEKNEYGQSAIDFAINSDAKKISAFLSGTLTADADEAAIAAGGMTLHQAAEKGDAVAIKAIVKTGVDVNGLKDGERYYGGCTALSVAVAFLQSDVVDALLECGADPAYKDGNGHAALYYLVHLDTMSTMRAGGLSKETISKILKSMVSAGFKMDQPIDDDGNTLLNLACSIREGTGENYVINAVLRNNPNINLPNRFGQTPLMRVCAGDFDDLENIQLVLLEQGADVSVTDSNGDTAMHYAARNGNKTGAKVYCDMLLEFGADSKTVNNSGKTALDIAVEKENEPLAKLLLNKM